jgi:hypothetical protein
MPRLSPRDGFASASAVGCLLQLGSPTATSLAPPAWLLLDDVSPPAIHLPVACTPRHLCARARKHSDCDWCRGVAWGTEGIESAVRLHRAGATNSEGGHQSLPVSTTSQPSPSLPLPFSSYFSFEFSILFISRSTLVP